MNSSKSWLQFHPRSPFSLANIPFGIISTKSNASPRPAVAIGDHVLDLLVFADQGGFSKLQASHTFLNVFRSPTLNDFAALGRSQHRKVRHFLQDVFAEDTPHPEVLKENESLRGAALIPSSAATNHLPLAIGDYTDFFAGRNHAANVGTLFRGPANALQPNYSHLPVAYHGRASSVVVSGTPLHRPWGQVITEPSAEPKVPTFMPCRRLDIELEMGMFVSRGNELGRPIPLDQAEEHIFGYVLMNDWSARDIQQWEYVPLGPFNAKNFGTTISPWVVLADAFEPFRAPGLENSTSLVSYLKQSRDDFALDISLEVDVLSESGLVQTILSRANDVLAPKGDKTTITRTSSKNVIWSWEQMVAHHSVAGCNLRTGDLFGSGTVSGSEPGSHGSMLEQSGGGKQKIKLSGGDERTFLQDGDTIIIKGVAGNLDGELVGFGECVGQILPAIQLPA